MTMFPWQTDSWNQVQKRLASRGLAHALLIDGPEGCGKKIFAEELAKLLLCQHAARDSSAHTACGHCHSCQLFTAGNHPDLLWAQPQEKSRQIRIDSIRQVNEFIAQTPQISQGQVVIIDPVDVLNLNASNALLKTLEEPAGNSYLLLLSERPGSVMPTIKSRCQRLSLNVPNQQQALEWVRDQFQNQSSNASGQSPEHIQLALRLSHGAPLAALRLLQDDGIHQIQQWLQQLLEWRLQSSDLQTVIDRWNKIDLTLHVTYWLMAISDVLKYELGVAQDHCHFPAQQYGIQPAYHSAQLNKNALLQLQKDINEVNGGLQSGLSFYNSTLLNETWLLRWQSAFLTI